MTTDSLFAHRLRLVGGVLSGLAAAAALAFPPAPHHTVYGTVRDELGNPLSNPGAEVLLEGNGTSLVRTPVAASTEPGVNYRLAIPLDSAATGDLYKPSALRPTVPVRMRVRVGSIMYLPIEMTGVANLLTRPGAASRVDLTLGIDSDGDGLPDAWERALIQMLPGDRTLDDIRPGDDSDGDGMSNGDEYLAGTYAFAPEDGFVLELVSLEQGGTVLEFTAIRGRSYRIFASDDMKAWVTVPFTLAAETSGEPARPTYQAEETRLLRVRAGWKEGDEPTLRFYKLQVQ